MKARSQSSSIRTRRSRRGLAAAGSNALTKASVLRELERQANPRVRAKMAHFGVNVEKAHGISAPVLHALARRIGRSHKLANQLWATGIHEAKILATLIGEPKR